MFLFVKNFIKRKNNFLNVFNKFLLKRTKTGKQQIYLKFFKIEEKIEASIVFFYNL